MAPKPLEDRFRFNHLYRFTVPVKLDPDNPPDLDDALGVGWDDQEPVAVVTGGELEIDGDAVVVAQGGEPVGTIGGRLRRPWFDALDSLESYSPHLSVTMNLLILRRGQGHRVFAALPPVEAVNDQIDKAVRTGQL